MWNDLRPRVIGVDRDRGRLPHPRAARQELHEHERGIDPEFIQPDLEQLAVAIGGPLRIELLPRPRRLRHHLNVLGPHGGRLPHPPARVDERLVELLPGGRDRVPETDHARHEETGVADPLAEVGEAPAPFFVFVEFAFPRFDRISHWKVFARRAAILAGYFGQSKRAKTATAAPGTNRPSSSPHLSSSTGSLTSCRRPGSTGIAATASLPRITSSGPPSRRMTKGNVGKRRDAATGGHAVGGHAARGDATGRSRPTSDRRFASGRRPGWLRPREVSP
jgi:hypothetical protein